VVIDQKNGDGHNRISFTKGHGLNEVLFLDLALLFSPFLKNPLHPEGFRDAKGF
jgi:hypothetical protein